MIETKNRDNVPLCGKIETFLVLIRTHGFVKEKINKRETR